MFKIADPVASMERICERMHETERNIAEFEALGFTRSVRRERKRLAGLKSAKTRLIRFHF